MLDRFRRLREGVVKSDLAKASLAANAAVPILAWVIVARMQADLLVMILLSNFSAAVQLMVLPLVPAAIKVDASRRLQSNELIVLAPATFALATVIALVVAVIRSRRGEPFSISVAIGYLAAFAGIQIVGAIPWILLALLMSNAGPY